MEYAVYIQTKDGEDLLLSSSHSSYEEAWLELVRQMASTNTDEYTYVIRSSE